MTRTAAALAAVALLVLSTPTFAAPDGAPIASDASSTVSASKITLTTAPPKAPEDVKEALSTAKKAYAAAKGGNWWYFSALAITVLLWLLKWIGKKYGFWPKLGRWRYVISPVLSLAAALLAAFQGGVSFEIVLGVFSSSYATSSFQELVEHGVLNKPRASASG